MTIRNYTFKLLILLLCPLWLATPLVTPAQAGENEASITLDFKDIELSDLIQTISALTDKNFVYDDSIRGKATIISAEQMTKDEAYQLFLTVLNIKGYTVVPSGKTNKIVATKTASENNLPMQTTATQQDQFVTSMIALKHIDAVSIASAILSPLMPKTSNIAVYEPSNMLIITDNAANIDRLKQIVKQLDQPGAIHSMQVIALKYADAKDTAAICNDIIGEKKNASTSRRKANVQSSGSNSAGQVIAYERTNCLIVMAAEEDLKIINQLVTELDRPLTSDRSHFNLYYLENADAETLSTTLNEIISGVKNTTKTTTPPLALGTQTAAVINTDVSITADKPTNSLIVNATPEDYAVIKDIIKQLDIRRKQVYVEALIMELSMDATEKLGLGLQGGFEVGDEGVAGISTNMTSSVSADLLTSSVEGILAGGFSKLIEYTDSNGDVISIPAFSALLQLSKTDTNVNILSAPRLLTSANEEAEIIVGRNVPIITSRLTDTGSTSSLATSVSVERQDVALTLRFTPQITEGDLITMTVYQETSDLIESGNNESDNYIGPTFTTRKISNTVLAKDGQTVVLGGLISTNITNNKTKVPFLGDIPLLGWLFRSTSDTKTKTNMLVFITPTIIKNNEDLNTITSSNRQQIEALKAEQNAETATEPQ
ncbi:MAG: type II secretion system secretin GspD [Desulfuromonas sp.]|nr:type II secretion system secretin GspD [Desulfuromonas sp.]